MANKVSSVKLTDNTRIVRKATEEQLKAALEAVGLKAEGYAKLLCPVDTGLLRNSITHAIYGQSPSIKIYKADRPNKKNIIQSGKYTGKAPSVSSGQSVYIGTNVEYAADVESGHIDSKTGAHVKAKPFLKPAIFNHVTEYKQIFKEHLKK